jgi:murein DD-endopeptidase MepM/ murein hydrolase activator NlpD
MFAWMASIAATGAGAAATGARGTAVASGPAGPGRAGGPARSGAVLVAALGDEIESKRAAIGALHARLDRKRGQLQFQERREADLARQLQETNSGIARVSATLGVLEARARWNERKLAWNQVQLDGAEATLQRHDDALKRRLVDAYERGDLGYVNVLLASTSFNDFAERWEDIRYLIVANEKTVRERQAAERAVAAARTNLEGERAELSATLDQERQTKFALAALATARSNLVAMAAAQRRSVANEVVQLEDLSAAQEAQLEAYIRERQREEDARRAAEAEARRRAALLAGAEAPPAAIEGAPGYFAWPASGPITSPFGMRVHPVTGQFKMHTGIDIGAPMGATITAAAGGRVIFAGWEGGYGNTIIIDHGGQTSTLYGHCSQIFVSDNQDVARGQAIGAVGATGDATGPHLHFEIRVNGVAVDPTSRLR